MPKKTFTEEQIAQEQIAHVLRQAEAGVPVAELIRKTGITEPTFYRSIVGRKSLLVWVWPSCVVCASSKKKTRSSSSWWPICHWTRRCFRR